MLPLILVLKCHNYLLCFQYNLAKALTFPGHAFTIVVEYYRDSGTVLSEDGMFLMKQQGTSDEETGFSFGLGYGGLNKKRPFVQIKSGDLIKVQQCMFVYILGIGQIMPVLAVHLAVLPTSRQ